MKIKITPNFENWVKRKDKIKAIEYIKENIKQHLENQLEYFYDVHEIRNFKVEKG